MMRVTVLILVIVAGSFTSVCAETYTWTDEQGTVHFTEDPGAVPAGLRKKALMREDYFSAPAPAVPAKESNEALPAASPVYSGAGAAGSGDLYGGKRYQQWQKELADSEEAMTAVRSRLDELAVKLKNCGTNWSLQNKLLTEYKPLEAAFKKMKVEYNQLVESARKAGLVVDIQQQ